MLYIPKVDDYLENLTNEEVNDLVAINFSRSIREEKNLRKVAKLLHIFLTTPDEVESNYSDNFANHYNVEIWNIFDPELQLINTKQVIIIKLKLLSLKLVLIHKKKEIIVKFFIHVLNRLLKIQTLMKHLNPCMKAL